MHPECPFKDGGEGKGVQGRVDSVSWTIRKPRECRLGETAAEVHRASGNLAKVSSKGWLKGQCNTIGKAEQAVKVTQRTPRFSGIETVRGSNGKHAH